LAALIGILRRSGTATSFEAWSPASGGREPTSGVVVGSRTNDLDHAGRPTRAVELTTFRRDLCGSSTRVELALFELRDAALLSTETLS
jgi:hypothetical protein